jgi:hypothetical protein
MLYLYLLYLNMTNSWMSGFTPKDNLLTCCDVYLALH